jgi:hypothetical protein
MSNGNKQILPPSPGGRGGGTGSTTGAGMAGGGGFQVSQGNAPTFDTRATPMFFQSTPTTETTTVSPYGNLLDILTMDQKLLLCKMVKPYHDHILLDMNVTNSKAIVDLFQDRVIIF